MKIEKKNAYQFFFPTFEAVKVSNFTSGWVQYRARLERLEIAGLCCQHGNASLAISLPFKMFEFCIQN